MLQNRLAGIPAGGVVHSLHRPQEEPLLIHRAGSHRAAVCVEVAAAVAMFVASVIAVAPEVPVIWCIAAVLRTRASQSQIIMRSRRLLSNLQRRIRHLRFVVWLPRRKTVRIILLSLLRPSIKSSVFRDSRYRRASSPKLPQRNGALVATRHLADIVLRELNIQVCGRQDGGGNCEACSEPRDEPGDRHGNPTARRPLLGG
mmetsp:Transcript_77971/g.252957  ORF Transcript_77971/g.252957 Transcript_77971/m.252957 type:complete len:201 (+) Transcript_77971:422-1024(+)